MAQINFSYDPGTNFTQILAFETAGKVWEAYLQDNTTINIHVGVTAASNLPNKVIGGALPGMQTNTSYQEFATRRGQDITSQADQIAYGYNNSPRNNAQYQLRFSDGQVFSDFISSDVINMTRANAKALGIEVENSSGIDGYILMSNLQGQGTSWDHDTKRQRSTVAHKLDFMTTALHEIGHVLGFVSGVDEKGWSSAQINLPSYQFWQGNESDAIKQAMTERLQQINPLDLYRYSAATAANQNPDITYGSEWSEKYFSIDGGQTNLAYFSSGLDTAAGGDGYQASHWKQQGQQQDQSQSIMEPALSLGNRSTISPLDLQAMDVIGWDIASTGAATPINFRTLYYEAKRELAARLGTSVTWLNKNWNEAASQLTQDRGDDLFRMLQNSQYDMSWLNPWATGGRTRFQAWRNFWAQGGSQRFQMISQVFEQRSRFSTLDDLVLDNLVPTNGDASDAALIPADLSPEAAVVNMPVEVEGGLSPNLASGNVAGSFPIANTAPPQGLETLNSLTDNLAHQQPASETLIVLGSKASLLILNSTTIEHGLTAPLTGLGGDQLLDGSGLGSLASL